MSDARQAAAILDALRPGVRAELCRLLNASDNVRVASRRDPIAATPELLDRDGLVERYTRMSVNEIAIEIGCNEKTVKTWMRRHKIPLRSAAEASRHRHSQSRTDRRDLILAALRDMADHSGRPPSTTEWEAGRPLDRPSEKTVRAIFGSWNAAIEAAGLEPRPPGGMHEDARSEQKALSRKILIAALRDWAEAHENESPTLAEWDFSRPVGAPSERVARKLFGSWNAALEAAGLAPRPSGQRKRSGQATSSGKTPGRNRQMVTGAGLDDRRPGTVKHFGRGMKDVA